MQSRTSFLKGLTAAGAVALAGDAAIAAPGAQLGWRFGRTASPRVSVSLPETWFLTEQLTDVPDPIQLFTISNRAVPRHRNVAGTVNAALIPVDGVLLTAFAFKLTPEMAAWEERSAAPPARVALASLPAKAVENLRLSTRAWAHIGERFGVQLLVWTGDAATPADIRTLDTVLESIHFDESL